MSTLRPVKRGSEGTDAIQSAIGNLRVVRRKEATVRGRSQGRAIGPLNVVGQEMLGDRPGRSGKIDHGITGNRHHASDAGPGMAQLEVTRRTEEKGPGIDVFPAADPGGQEKDEGEEESETPPNAGARKVTLPAGPGRDRCGGSLDR